MTGFGRGTVTEPAFAITVELKTVNNRFLDVTLKLSSEMQPLEAKLQTYYRPPSVTRPRPRVSLQYDRTSEIINYELNRPLITGFLAAMKHMQDEFSLSGEPDINVLAQGCRMFSLQKITTSTKHL